MEWPGLLAGFLKSLPPVLLSIFEEHPVPGNVTPVFHFPHLMLMFMLTYNALEILEILSHRNSTKPFCLDINHHYFIDHKRINSEHETECDWFIISMITCPVIKGCAHIKNASFLYLEWFQPEFVAWYIALKVDKHLMWFHFYVKAILTEVCRLFITTVNILFIVEPSCL